MESVKVSRLVEPGSSINRLSLALDGFEKHSLKFAPWPVFSYKPQVQFSIAYNERHIFLKYYVVENHIRGAAGNINGAVWEDTCVEFFVGFDERGYYNLEFNCLGTILIGYNKDGSDCHLLPEQAIRKIKYQSVISNSGEKDIQWELTLSIPLDVFVYHDLSSLQNKNCRANFYKCGDALPQPHYISWSNIEAPEPDFHLPQFFGELLFDGELAGTKE